MFQALFDKFADLLLPILAGLLVWYGFHYFVLTPRIIKVEQSASYSRFHQGKQLPQEVTNCIDNNVVPTTLSHARLEAALFTASLKNVAAPYHKKLSEIGAIIDEKCGVAAELERQERIQNVTEAREQAIDELKFLFNMFKGYAR